MFRCYVLIAAMAAILFGGLTPAFAADEPIALGTRRELLVDQFLIEKLDGVLFSFSNRDRRSAAVPSTRRSCLNWERSSSVTAVI